MLVAYDVALDLVRALRPVVAQLRMYSPDAADQVERAASSAGEPSDYLNERHDDHDRDDSDDCGQDADRDMPVRCDVDPDVSEQIAVRMQLQYVLAGARTFSRHAGTSIRGASSLRQT